MTTKEMRQRQRQKREAWMAFVHQLNPDIDHRATRLMDELRMVAHALYQIGEHSVTTAGLSYAKYRILLGLLFCEECEERSGLNPSEISERQGTARNTISALIRDLETEGLVERQLDQFDRRKFNIRLTEAGRTLVRDHASQHLRIISQCFTPFTPEEQQTFSRLLSKLSQTIDDVTNTAFVD